jgi:hypothetical protein
MAKQQKTAPDPLANLRVADATAETGEATAATDKPEGAADAEASSEDDPDLADEQARANIANPPPAPGAGVKKVVRNFVTRDTTISWGHQFIKLKAGDEITDGVYGPNAFQRMVDNGVPMRFEEEEVKG